jgi:hypothetical protein
MLLSVAFALSLGAVPHRELPATFLAGRAFVMPRVSSTRRLALWIDSDGSGFLRSGLVSELHLQRAAQNTAYFPPLIEPGFPPVTGNRGALPILDDADVAADPVFSGIDGQLGWTWLAGRIWTIDYAGHRLYQDYSAPPYPSADVVPLEFDRAHRYPAMHIGIAGTSYRAALDTAASVALSPAAVQRLGDGLPPIRAASFVPKRTFDAWHAAHPDWMYIPNAGAGGGVSLIRVPEVRAARIMFHDVWFSTRPNDDVFQCDTVDLKLGPTAFSRCAVTIDYVHDAAAFECSG